ncbi:hypothetical protein M3M38_00070 [Fructilactobacillus cliffordii]|uniref:hypothetical protein n=1 Tax=Fructilactobacillus cliffordii TaxID=2940299 RepID=UPI002093EAEB|nr:hypothetical protein [Fructilactobacillus cliffordii]USS86512.1 hypothetical protein M3M38_00070 [Fructilactobacillus cliffordii]
MPLSNARKKANKKWDYNNKRRKQYLNRRSTAKNFILKEATKDDLVELKSYIATREKDFEE